MESPQSSCWRNVISVFESCPLSTQNDPYSVKILRSSAKVSPEPIIPTLVSQPELAPRCVFGVTLETLREDGQMVCGIPLVLRDMVQFLDKNGIFLSVTALLSFHSDPCIALSVHSSTDNTDLILLFPCHRNRAQGSVPSVWLSGEDQAAEAAVGQWGEGGPGA